jgi:hypothetical protein
LTVLVAILALNAVWAHSLSALSITAGSVSGPGGLGSPNFFANVSEAALTYTSVDYLDISLTVDAAGYYDLSQAPSQGFVTNNSGVPWTGFKIEILSSDVAVEFTPALFPPPGDPPAYDYGGVFPFPAWSTSLILFSGGPLNSGFSMAPVSAFQMAGAGTVVFRETPIVPEPSSVLLATLGSALALATAIAKKRPKVAS